MLPQASTASASTFKQPFIGDLVVPDARTTPASACWKFLSETQRKVRGNKRESLTLIIYQSFMSFILWSSFALLV